MRWPVAVPMLMTQVRGAAFRNPGARGRVRSGEAAFGRTICIALALAASESCRRAGEIAPRAAQLAAIAPKLRAKGAG